MEKILILIDDDSMGNIVNEKMLSKRYSDHTFKIFGQPEKALEYFASLDNDALIENEFTMFLDLNMPSLSGFEFLEELEYIEGLMDNPDDAINLKVFLLTSENSIFVEEKLKTFSMIKDYILKPLTPDTIPVFG